MLCSNGCIQTTLVNMFIDICKQRNMSHVYLIGR